MEEVDLRDSKNLARWAPGLMREVARAILTQVRKQVVKLRKLSWQEHHRVGTLPDEEGLPSLSGGEWSRPTP